MHIYNKKYFHWYLTVGDNYYLYFSIHNELISSIHSYFLDKFPQFEPWHGHLAKRLVVREMLLG